MRLSVILPTLNEAAFIGSALRLVRENAGIELPEVIVADCGSADATVEIARREGVRLVTGRTLTNRARACNAGAESATGDVLLFLHADSRVPVGYDALIAATVAADGVVGGAFEFKLAGSQWRLRLVELMNRVRYGFGGAYFGDQGLFVLHDAFRMLGGFPNVSIMEDAYFCRRVCRLGRTRVVRVPMITSPRRFYSGGILSVLLADTLIWIYDMLGLNLSAFAEKYRLDNIRRGGDARRCRS